VTLSDGRRTWTEACDYLACGFHLVPNVELAALLGCEIRDGAVVVDTWQETTTAGVYCAGEPTGVGGAEAALVEGEIAGLAAAGRMEAARELLPHRARWHRFRAMMSETFALRDELHALPDPDTVVCRCEDVRHGALDAFGGWRAAKLQTRCGMGACQGRTCGAAVRFLRGWEAVSTRPPVFPASVGALAGAPMSADHDHDSTRPNQTNR
jgi:NADPH-dependent 2,4-dienoyl-CoA reductase/sulfur reductase-like enzyme